MGYSYKDTILSSLDFHNLIFVKDYIEIKFLTPSKLLELLLSKKNLYIKSFIKVYLTYLLCSSKVIDNM